MNPTAQFRCATAMIAVAAALGAIGRLEAGPTKHEVAIEALCRESALDRYLSYLIRPGRPAFDERSLRHKEVVTQIRTALSGLGLFEAPSGVRPDMIIEFDYGIGPVRTRYIEVTEPVFESAGGGLQTASRMHGPGGSPQREEENRGRMVGYATVRRPIHVREKFLAVTARANLPTLEARPAPELWRINASIEDKAPELRNHLPVLAAAIMEQAGGTTDGRVTLEFADNSDDVAFIRRGM